MLKIQYTILMKPSPDAKVAFKVADTLWVQASPRFTFITDDIPNSKFHSPSSLIPCNVSHWHDEIPMKNSKCAISKLYKKDGRTSRCGKRIKKKPRGDRAKKNDKIKRRSEKMSTNARKNEMMSKHLKTDGMCHLSGKLPKDETCKKPNRPSP